MSEWADATLRDLAHARSLILDTHPGALDNHHGFNQWLDEGYAQASQRAMRAKTGADSLAILRFFLSGFEDGHLGVDSASRAGSRWAGFIVERRGDDYRVAKAAHRWPAALPPVGAKVVSCGGRPVRDILREDVAPYVDRRLALEATWYRLALLLTVEHGHYPTLERRLADDCLVELPDGTLRSFPLHWRSDTAELDSLLTSAAPSIGMSAKADGVYWIQAPSFAPSAADNLAIDQLVQAIHRARGQARWIVVDVRGNTGGNSLVGGRLLYALLGKDAADDLRNDSGAYAEWRVSRLARSTLDRARRDIERNFGATSESYRWISQLGSLMDDAVEAGDLWVRQPEVSISAFDADAPADPYKGRLALITDSGCASACLDLADAVLRVPGAVHLGLPTSGDTIYIDVGAAELASGAVLRIPLKVWRNRPRGHNQAYVPRFVFPGDINDRAAIQAWTLDILGAL